MNGRAIVNVEGVVVSVAVAGTRALSDIVGSSLQRVDGSLFWKFEHVRLVSELNTCVRLSLAKRQAYCIAPLCGAHRQIKCRSGWLRLLRLGIGELSLASFVLFGHLRHSNCQGRATQRLDERRVLGIERACLVDYGGIRLLGMRGQLLHFLRRNLLSLLRG